LSGYLQASKEEMEKEKGPGEGGASEPWNLLENGE
jgi:hypothetical protein